MNPPALKIQTTHTLAETCANKNVVTKSLNCVVPRFTNTASPLVDMVIIELTIIMVMSGKNVLMMPSPAMLMCSDLVLAYFAHVNSLCNDEEDALAFEKMVSHLSHVCFFSRLHTSHEKFRAQNYSLVINSDHVRPKRTRSESNEFTHPRDPQDT